MLATAPPASADPDPRRAIRLVPAPPSQDFGLAVQGLDFDGDGQGELAISQTVSGLLLTVGRINLYRRTPDGLQVVSTLDSYDGAWGDTLAAGDLSGDGKDDLLIGSPG